MVGKDSRDTLRRVQRQLRDLFAARAEELHRSTTEALAAAQQAVRSSEAARAERRREVAARSSSWPTRAHEAGRRRGPRRWRRRARRP